ncbi:MAG: hypothetical protein LBF59_05245 [Prevotellaceae bacterium]|nr:hypothetical protein [Prevotellaceae bacterium]
MRRNETQYIASLRRTMLWSLRASICRDAIFCVSTASSTPDNAVVVEGVVENVVEETQYIASLHRTMLWSLRASICRDAIFCVSSRSQHSR